LEPLFRLLTGFGTLAGLPLKTNKLAKSFAGTPDRPATREFADKRTDAPS
jgi:hypothetical protein